MNINRDIASGLTPATLLVDLPLPHLGVVLDEIFLIPPKDLFADVASPQTVAELATQTRLSVAEVIARLERIIRMSEAIEIEAQALKVALDATSDAPILIEVREGWEYDICHVPGSILLTKENFGELLPKLQAAKSVVTICHHGMRSYSAAMFLKQNGVPHVRSLVGGVDAWAREVDASMRRY